MASGQRPFTGQTAAALSDSILHTSPSPLRSANPSISPDLDRIIRKALEKAPEKPFASAAEMRAKFQGLRQRHLIESSTSIPIRTVVHKPWFIAAALIVLPVAGVSTFLMARHRARLNWVHQGAISEIQPLASQRKPIAAYRLIRQAEQFAAKDPELERVKAGILEPAWFRSTPPGADIYIRDYDDVHSGWEYLGKTPRSPVKNP